MFRELRRRLTGWYLVVLAGVLVAYGGGSFLVARNLLQHALDDTNLHAATPLLQAAEKDRHPHAAVADALTALGMGQGEHVAVLATDGTPRWQRGGTLPRTPALQLGTSTVTGNPAVRILVLPIRRQGVTVGYLRVGHSLDDQQRILHGIAVSLLGMIPLALAVAWAGGRWLAGKSLQPLATAFQREQNLTRDASHELRTPLAVILAHTELAMAQGCEPALKDKLDVIRATAGKMQHVIDDLLILGRLDAGIGEAGLRFSLADVVEEEVDALAPLAAARKVRLRAELGEGAGDVVGDPARLARAVRNLLDNALRYTPAGGAVTVQLAAQGSWVSVTIQDTGAGITAADQTRLFERFARLEHGRKSNPDGSGLGLAISRAIARGHGGDIRLESKPGHGARFTLRLPSA